ncbi:MAG: hypothetical protein HYZ26_13635 [Chloroflexi bacterium]|nr:hypothetical protein [Chloroflexota bacterium]
MTTKEVKLMTTGPAAAAMIGSGIGALVMGLMTTGAELSAALKTFLTWTAPVGPLSGKTGMAIIAWLIAWALLNTFWKGKDVSIDKAFRVTLALIAVGVLFTFPPFFEAFAE